MSSSLQCGLSRPRADLSGLLRMRWRVSLGAALIVLGCGDGGGGSSRVDGGAAGVSGAAGEDRTWLRAWNDDDDTAGAGRSDGRATGGTGGVRSGAAGGTGAGQGGTGGDTGGAGGTGGRGNTGGSPSVGGTSNSGGSFGNAGDSSSGGDSGTGGALATGGRTGTGGSSNIGGSSGTGGRSNTGGRSSTGGSSNSGGSAETGGTESTGGTSDTGGTTSSGGVSGDGGEDPVLPADVELLPALPCTGSTVLCVREGASGGDGTLSAPYSTIVEALAVAGNGDTIQVTAGTYTGSLIIVGREITLLGGFSDDFGTRDLTGFPTYISTSGGDAAVTLTDAGESRVEGFIITGGTGGGICVYGGAPLISSNVIEDNDTRGGGACGEAGAGIGSENADITIVGNLIRNNISTYGGGVATNRGSVTIDRNTIQDNTGNADHGGGMYIASTVTMSRNLIEGNTVGVSAGYGWGGGVIVFGDGNTATFISNVIRRNSAPSIGSGVFFDDGIAATMTNDLVYGNVCPEYGGAGVYVDGLHENLGSTLTVRNVTIAGHDCANDLGGNGILLERGSTVDVVSSILWGNDRSGREFFNDGSCTISVRYSDVEEVVDGLGNISADPLFADAASGDFHLRSAVGRFDEDNGWVTDSETSPCIDAADPAASFDREPSPNGGRADMGAYGNTAQASMTP